MHVLSQPIAYVPNRSVTSPGPAARVGRAFSQVWREGSDLTRAHLAGAIRDLATQLRAERASPEASVIAFKEAIYRFGGLHSQPGLTDDHHMDGEASQAAYAAAFAMFVEAYFVTRGAR